MIPCRRRRTSLVLVCCLLAAGCGSGGDVAAHEQDPAPTTRPSAYEGDEFYRVPSPLPSGPHGTLIRYQPMADYEIGGATTYRIMYLSRSVSGSPIAVTGMASVPTAPAPKTGRPMISVAHGTTGIADRCAPSRQPGPSEMTLVAGGRGKEYLVAATDYEGLGTPGRHPYLVGRSEGRSTLDALVAAGQLPGAHPGSRFALAGYSQGGHGALWAAELARTWAPDLELVGTFAGAPATEIATMLDAVPHMPSASYALMMVAGLHAAYPAADPATFLTPAGLEELGQVDQGCIADVYGALVGHPTSELVRPDGDRAVIWDRLGTRQDAGGADSGAPVLIIHSADDLTVPPAFSERGMARMCGHGQVVERRTPSLGLHLPAVPAAYNMALEWIDERFADSPAARDDCP